MQHETFSEILNVSFGRYRTMSISTKLEEFIFCIYNRLLLNVLQVISQKYGRNF